MMPAEMRQPAEANESSRGETLLRGTALAFAARLIGGISTAAITLFLVRRLGPAGYGAFALGLSIEALLYMVSDFGVVQAFQRFVAENRHEPGAVKRIALDAMRLKLLGSVIVAAALIALAGPIAGAYGVPRLTWVLRGIALSLVGMNFLLVCAGIYTALRRQSMTLVTYVLESIAEVAATVTLVSVAGGAVAAAFGRAIGYLIGGGIAVWLTFRLIGVGRRGAAEKASSYMRKIVRDARTILVVDAAYSVYAQIDSLLIGAFLTIGSVAIWQAPLRLLILLTYPAQAITSAVAPRMARSPDHPAERESFAGAIKVLVVLMAAVTTVTTVWATPIVRIALGSQFRASADVLRALAPLIFLSGFAGLVSVGMNYLGMARRRLPIALGTVAVNVVADVILIPRIGVLGGAVGTDLAFSLYVPAHFRICQRELNVAWVPLLRTLARSALACGAMAGVLVAFGTGDLSVVRLVAGGVLATLAYGLVLVLTGEIRGEQMTRATSALRSRTAPGG
jgi:O-antigen/teichoic acid export membrane protein